MYYLTYNENLKYIYHIDKNVRHRLLDIIF